MESILKQSFIDFELILVDDGSPDECPILCDQYAENDSRVHVIHKQNEGPSSARNKGIEKASGEYILFVDSDDWIELNYLDVIDSNISEHVADLYVLGFIIETSNGVVYKNINYKFKRADDRVNIIEEEMQYRHWGNPWNKVYRRDLIVSNKVTFNESMNYSEDALFNFEYAKYADSIVTIDAACYHYKNANTQSSLSQRIVSIEEFVDILNKLVDTASEISKNPCWVSFLRKYYNNELLVWLYITPLPYIRQGVHALLNSIYPINHIEDLYWPKGKNRLIWFFLLKSRSPHLVYYYMKLIYLIKR